jgi:hypothetical protein
MSKWSADASHISSETGEDYGLVLARLEAKDAAAIARFAAIWTLETTQARRAEWNALNVQPRERAATEKRLGYTFGSLVAAIHSHNL